MEVRLESLPMRANECIGEEFLGALPPLAICRNGFVKEHAAILFRADSCRSSALNLIVAHSAGKVGLVLADLDSCLKLFP